MKDLITKNTGLSVGLLIAFIVLVLPMFLAYTNIKVEMAVITVTMESIDKRLTNIEKALSLKLAKGE